jgi:FAD/FMN-containing dehydrogenase
MSYEEKKLAAVEQLLQLKSKGQISLKPKFTSHFFRVRKKKNKLDLNNFNTVIRVDKQKKVVEVEGMCTFYDLTKEVLKHGFLPAIVPELRNITIGGTISGLGIESSSFIYGMVHNAVEECEVLTSTGEVILCSRKKNSDLFYLLPNSIGSVGYVLKCTFKLRPAKKFVRLNFRRYSNLEIYFQDLKKHCDAHNADFIDGVILSKNHAIIIEGTLTDILPSQTKTKNFRMSPYWRFVADTSHSEVYMTVWDYIWRWDTDAFWSVSEGWIGRLTENKIFRFTLGRFFLRSHILGKMNHLKSKYFKSSEPSKVEYILQDLCVDIDKCRQFFDWYEKEIAVYPLWICPASNKDEKGKYVLLNFDFDYMVDIGIYTGKARKEGESATYYNRLLEEKVVELKGMKGLYSVSHFTIREFWRVYDEETYFKLKKKFDPEDIFPDIFAKTIGSKTL